MRMISFLYSKSLFPNLVERDPAKREFEPAVMEGTFGGEEEAWRTDRAKLFHVRLRHSVFNAGGRNAVPSYI